MYTIDTSVWLNATEPTESGHLQSRQFLTLCYRRNIPLYLPTLLLAEVGGAASRLRNQDRADRIVALLVRLPHVTYFPLDLTLARFAANLATTHRLRGADSVYAALALQEGTVLVSLDREHLTRLGGIVQTQTPTTARASLTP